MESDPPDLKDELGPVAQALQIVGDRWSIQLLLSLLQGQHRFTDFRKAIPEIATNVLSNRLKLFLAHGVIEQEGYSHHPPRNEYHLTKKGHQLGIVAGALASWGSKYLSDKHKLIHKTCGAKLQVLYHCPGCKSAVRGSEVCLTDESQS